MKRLGVVLAAVGLVGGFAMTAAFGQGDGEAKKERPEGRQGVRGGERGEMGRGGGMMMRSAINEFVIRRLVNEPKAATEMGISEEQIKALKEATEQLQKQREDLQKQLAELEEQQRKLMDEATVDEAAIMALLEKASKIRLDMEKASIKFVLLAKKTLTPDQVAKIKNMVQERMKARGEGERGRGEGERGRNGGERGEKGKGEGKGEGATTAPKPETPPTTKPAVW